MHSCQGYTFNRLDTDISLYPFVLGPALAPSLFHFPCLNGISDFFNTLFSFLSGMAYPYLSIASLLWTVCHCFLKGFKISSKNFYFQSQFLNFVWSYCNIMNLINVNLEDAKSPKAAEKVKRLQAYCLSWHHQIH